MSEGEEYRQEMEDVIAQLDRDFPELTALARSADGGPPLRLMCPKCGDLIEDLCLVGWDLDAHLMLQRVRADSARPFNMEQHAEWTDEFDGESQGEELDGPRLLIRHECGYSGRYRTARLMLAYARAVALGARQIPLPS